MNIPAGARSLLAGLLDLVFAPVCLGCGEAVSPAANSRLVCPACWAGMRPLPLPRCERCWSPAPLSPRGVQPRETCVTCSTLAPAIRAVRSAYLFTGPARQLVHALKYGGWTSVARPMGERMGALALPTEVVEEVRLVVPVPVGAVRMRERGYNQAQLLAAEIARFRGWKEGSGILGRQGERGTQTTLRPLERRANVAGAFRVGAGWEGDLRREHVLLVDDVWTTGATALACADALIGAGARAVSVVTFARAIPE
jgi:ComF family protein